MAGQQTRSNSPRRRTPDKVRQLQRRLWAAAKRSPERRFHALQGYVDPLATRAAGSLAWWCRWTLDAWEDEHPLGDRLRPEEIPTYVAFALHKLRELAPGLADALVRVFPLVPG